MVHNIDEKRALRLTDLSDAARIFELTEQSREHLREWLPWLDTTTKLEDTEHFIRSGMASRAANKSLSTVMLYEGEIVGVAGLNQINWSNRTATIGYWLGEAYQGRGIMTMAARALIDYAFNQLDLHKVEIRVASGNIKSRSIPKRLGFVEEGCIRQAEWLYDHYIDHIVYGLLVKEWKKSFSEE